MLNKLKCLSLSCCPTFDGHSFHMVLSYDDKIIVAINNGTGGCNFYQGNRRLINRLEKEASRVLDIKFEALDLILCAMHPGDTADSVIEKVKEMMNDLEKEFASCILSQEDPRYR